METGVDCQNCGYTNEPSTRFCRRCGRALNSESIICANCEYSNPPNNRFCLSCGAALNVKTPDEHMAHGNRSRAWIIPIALILALLAIVSVWWRDGRDSGDEAALINQPTAVSNASSGVTEEPTDEPTQTEATLSEVAIESMPTVTIVPLPPTAEVDTSVEAIPGTVISPAGNVINPENAAQVVERGYIDIPGSLTDVAYSPLGDYLAVASTGSIHVYDSNLLTDILVINSTANDVDWSPNGETLALARGSGIVELRDVRSEGSLIARFEGRTEGSSEGVYSVAWSPDGQRLVSASGDLYVREALSGNLLVSIEKEEIVEVDWSPTSDLLAFMSDYPVYLWDMDPYHGTENLPLDNSRVFDTIAFSADGGMLAAGAINNGVQVWNVGARSTLFEGEVDWVDSVAFSPNGRLLATGSRDGTILLWDTSSGQTLAQLGSYPGSVVGLSWSPDGRTLTSVSTYDMVRLWGIP